MIGHHKSLQSSFFRSYIFSHSVFGKLQNSLDAITFSLKYASRQTWLHFTWKKYSIDSESFYRFREFTLR